MARSSAASPPPRPKAATISRVKPKTSLACSSPLPSTQPISWSAGTSHVLEDHLGRVGGADAVLDLLLAHLEPGGAALHHEEAGAARRLGQDGVQVGDRAVGDELLGAVQAVGRDRFALHDRLGHGLERGHVAARLGLGDPVGHDQPLLGHAPQPPLPLLLGGAHAQRIAAQGDGQKGGGHPQIELGHLLADPVDVPGPAAHAAAVLGEEDQVQPHLGPEHGADHLLGEDVLVVPLQALLRRELIPPQALQRIQ